MKVIIIEDEHLAAEKLTGQLTKYGGIEVINQFDSIKSAVNFFKTESAPDLLFLDIHLADGLSFEIFKQVEIKCPVIFTTAYDQYAIQAFKLNSVDYLLKPISSEDLAKAIDQFKELHFKEKKEPKPQLDIEQIKEIMSMMNKQYKSRFIIKKGDKIISLSTDKINCFFSEDKYTIAVNQKGEKNIVQSTIAELTSLLDPQAFYRINRKYIVNINAIKEILQHSNSRLKIKLNGIELDDLVVSREKVQDFKSWLDD